MSNDPFIFPKSRPLKIYQGADFRQVFQHGTRDHDGVFTPLPLTDTTFHAQIRDGYGAEDPVVDLTSENGGFEIVDEANGKFAMIITNAQTTAIPVPTTQDKPSDIPFKDYNLEIEKITNGLVQRYLITVARVYAEGVRS